MREENGNTRRKKRKQNFGNAAHSYARINEQNSHFDIHIRAIHTMIRYGGTVRGSKWGKCLSDANGKFVSLLYFVDSSKAFLNLIFVRYWPMNGFTFAFHPPATILNDGNRVSKFELNIIENLINSEGLFYFILAFESSLLFLIFFFFEHFVRRSSFHNAHELPLILFIMFTIQIIVCLKFIWIHFLFHRFQIRTLKPIDSIFISCCYFWNISRCRCRYPLSCISLSSLMIFFPSYLTLG